MFTNNILAYGAKGAMARHLDTAFLSFSFQKNIFYYDQPAIQYGYWYCEGQTLCTSYFQFDNNLYFNKNVNGGQLSQPFFKTPNTTNGAEQPPITWLTFHQWQTQGEDLHSRFADPLFVNPTPGTDNYTLSTSSPAFTLGFVAFDPSQAGRLPSATLKIPVANTPAYPSLTLGVSLSSPASGGTYTNPVKFVASAVGIAPVIAMRIYVDGISMYAVSTYSLSTSLTLSTGTRNVVVQAWDSSGNIYKRATTITVN
jgi:hypothetical protein